jgi:arylsulfatase A-like enzyme
MKYIYRMISVFCILFFILQSLNAEENKPNIILIFADDLGIESLKTYGGHSTYTPNIDKLSREGMVFTHCFANPACSPSRAEFLTGTYPSDNGIQHVLSYFEDDTFLNPKEFKSFANQLKETGYTNAVAGKWNISWLEKNNTVKALGFDEHCLWQMYDKVGVKRSRFYQPHFRINDMVVEEEISLRFGPDVLCDFLVDFIDRNRKNPFLIYYPSLLVHTPYIKVPENPEHESLPDNLQKNGAECFPEMVNYLDINIGRLVDAVEKNGLSNNTIIIFLADNGTHKAVTSVWGDEGIKIEGGKMTMTDRGARVPLIVKWPEKVRPGTHCDDLVELADFLPTICEITSAPVPSQAIRGQSFYPQLLGKKGKPKKYVHIAYKENSQIRIKDWIYTNDDKLIKVNKLGEPENEPVKDESHKKTREELKNILEQIK